MAIDDKLDQAIAQVRMDQAQRGPTFARILERVAEGLTAGGPPGAIAAFSDALNSEATDLSAENSAYLLTIVIEEVKRLSLTFEGLTQHHQEFLNRDWIPLLVDADRKARATRAKERVARIAQIVSSSALAGPASPADDIEELMRIAMELTDKDVIHLQKLAAAQGAQIREQGRLTRYSAHMMWPWGDSPDPELDSTFSKLESYGLVSRIPPPNNLNIQKDFQNRYVLLRKGLKFIDLAREGEGTNVRYDRRGAD